MRKTILLLAISCIACTNLFSQIYKLETVFEEKATETYLSHWKLLENPNNSVVDTFGLWGYQLYHDSWITGPYEVEYFKGSAKEVFHFLKAINEFTDKYRNEDKVLTFISGVQVKTMKKLGFKYTLVYDTERKVVCKYNQKQWADILDKFVSYCSNQEIHYE